MYSSFFYFILFLFSFLEREKRVTHAWADKAQRGLVNFAREMKKIEKKMSDVADTNNTNIF